MNSLKKACAYLFTVVAGMGINFSLNSMVMGIKVFKGTALQRTPDGFRERSTIYNLLDRSTQPNMREFFTTLYYLLTNNGWDSRSVREIIARDIEYNAIDPLYVLPLADETSKCMVVDKNLTKCVYFNNCTKIALLGEVPLGYGNESNPERKKLLRHLGHRTMQEESDREFGMANVFDLSELSIPNPIFPEATDEIKRLAKEKGIAGYKMDNNQKFCSIF